MFINNVSPPQKRWGNVWQLNMWDITHEYGKMPFPHPRQNPRKKQGFCVFPRYPACFRSDSAGILRGLGVGVCLGRFRGIGSHNGETFGYYRACCQQYLEPAVVRVHRVPFFVSAAHLASEEDLEDERDVRVSCVVAGGGITAVGLAAASAMRACCL